MTERTPNPEIPKTEWLRIVAGAKEAAKVAKKMIESGWTDMETFEAEVLRRVLAGKRVKEDTARARWAYTLAIFLQEDPDLCNMLQRDLERAGIMTGLDERESTERFASVLDYVLQFACVKIDSDLSEYDEHEQGLIIYERLVATISTN